MRYRRGHVAGAAVLLLAGCGEPAPGPEEPAKRNPDPAAGTSVPWFVEDAAAAGLDFVHDSGARGGFLFPEISCGGGALFDMDGDGDLDAYFVQAGDLTAPPSARPPNRLYRNDGSGRFTDVTEGSGADDTGYGMGVATGDYDGDGDLDLYVTNVGPNRLLRNDGGGRFTDVTGLSRTGHAGWGTSAAFADYDADGDLDLFVVNYIHWTPRAERECYATTGERDYCAPGVYQAPAEDLLYRNDDGVFTDVSRAAGIDTAFGNGLGIVAGDLDGNGMVDFFVANDGMRNQMWMNRGDGRFEDEAALSGTALDRDGVAKAGMGVAAADVDDDGDLDLLVVNLVDETDSFYRNEGGYFVDDTAAVGLAGPSRGSTRFGAGFQDFDHDGRLDLFEACGRVRRQSPLYGSDPFAEPDVLLRGNADGRFVPAAPPGGIAAAPAATGRAAAFGDVDGDGDVDVLVVNRDGPVHLLRNVAPKRGRWLMLRVLDDGGGDAIGATVTATLGDRRITRDVRTAYSYCSANDARVHLGLGEAARVDAVTVRWPDGFEARFGPFDADRVVVLRRRPGVGPPR